ncbi:MAG: DUF3817 domain-containing protein [Myxococcales bacterium]|nr:DUF3817 domain-containing protein [Myxococcales bacterium]
MAKTLGILRWVGFLEGASFLVLLGIAMPLKYAMGMPIGVKVVGPIHGVLFMVYVAMAAHAVSDGWLSKGQGLKMAIASLLPFGPFVVDRELKAMAQRTAEAPVERG